jgi:hypothetical protein
LLRVVNVIGEASSLLAAAPPLPPAKKHPAQSKWEGKAIIEPIWRKSWRGFLLGIISFGPALHFAVILSSMHEAYLPVFVQSTMQRYREGSRTLSF